MSTKILAQALVTASLLYPSISAADKQAEPGDDASQAAPGDEASMDEKDSLDADTEQPDVDDDSAYTDTDTSGVNPSPPPPPPLEIAIEFRGTEAMLDAEEEALLDRMANWLAADSKRVLVIQAPPSVTAQTLELVQSRLRERGIDASRIAFAVLSDKQAEDVQVLYLSESKAPESNAPMLGKNTTNVVVVPPERESRSMAPHLMTPGGMSISVGGGVMDFTDGATRDFTGIAGTWEARLAYGTRSPIAAEVAYVGSARSVDALGLDSSAVILGSSVEAAMRLNFTSQESVQPYLVAGFGVTRWNVVNDEGGNTSSVKDSDTTTHVPVGFGIGFRQRGFLFDIRGTFRASLDDHLTSSARGGVNDPFEGDRPRSHTWQAGARIGWEF